METEECADIKFEASSPKLGTLLDVPMCLEEGKERVQKISSPEKNILINARIVNALVKDIGFDLEVVENVFRKQISHPGSSIVDAKNLVDDCIAVYVEYDKEQKIRERIAELLKTPMVTSIMKKGVEVEVIRSVLYKQFKTTGSTFVNGNLLAKACTNFERDSNENE